MWVSPPNLMMLLQFWDIIKFKNLEMLCWQVSFYAVVWTIWACRNEAVFNNKEWEMEKIIDLFKTRMASWINRKYNIKNYNTEDFKRCLEGIRKV